MGGIMKRKIAYILSILLIITLPTIFLLTSVDIAASDMDFFEAKYKEYDRPEKTGISHENLMKVTQELLSYLKGDRDNIIIYTEINGENRQVFMEREVLHLKDVKVLFQRGYLIRNISVIIALISIVFLFINNKKLFSKSFIVASLIPVGLMALLSIPLIINFYETFTIFHEIFFTNDLWLLDPKTEVLIQMYPLQFFNSIAFRIIGIFGTQLAITLAIGVTMRSLIKRKKIRV